MVSDKLDGIILKANAWMYPGRDLKGQQKLIGTNLDSHGRPMLGGKDTPPKKKSLLTDLGCGSGCWLLVEDGLAAVHKRNGDYGRFSSQNQNIINTRR